MASRAGIGWYGPLIDLSSAASHVGDLVQLIVFVHRSTPLQFKLSKGAEVIRTDIQVGDDTRLRFTVSLWQKSMGSMAMSGDVILLHNVKITKYGEVVSARTVNYSSVVPLVHPYELLVSKGVDELSENCHLGVATKEKLRKVVEWVKATRSSPHNGISFRRQVKQLRRNWKVLEEAEHRDFISVSEVLHLTTSCRASFHAYIGEILLPSTHKVVGELEKEKMFISWRLNSLDSSGLADDFICTGCQVCGSPLDLELSKPIHEQNSIPLYCDRSCNRLHTAGLIYRPFMLYIWDELEYLPLLVKNKAAEVLFGNICAGQVYRCYVKDKRDVLTDKHPDEGNSEPELEGGTCKDMDFHSIWLILLRLLLMQGKNSPLKFEVDAHAGLDVENGTGTDTRESTLGTRSMVSVYTILPTVTATRAHGMRAASKDMECTRSEMEMQNMENGTRELSRALCPHLQTRSLEPFRLLGRWLRMRSTSGKWTSR